MTTPRRYGVRKRLAVLAQMLTMLTMLAGCGDDNASTTPTTAERSTTTDGEEEDADFPTTTTAKGAVAAGGVARGLTFEMKVPTGFVWNVDKVNLQMRSASGLILAINRASDYEGDLAVAAQAYIDAVNNKNGYTILDGPTDATAGDLPAKEYTLDIGAGEIEWYVIAQSGEKLILINMSGPKADVEKAQREVQKVLPTFKVVGSV